MNDPEGYAHWAGRLSTALELLAHPTASPTMNDIRRNNARECLAQYEAWKDARRPVERGFVDLPGLAS